MLLSIIIKLWSSLMVLKTLQCQFVNFSCGFTGADPNVVVPNWHIIKRNRNGVVVSGNY